MSETEQRRCFRVLFSAPQDRMHNAPRSKGGVGHHSGSRRGHATFLYIPHSDVFIPCESAARVPNGNKRGGRERPPPKNGGACGPR